MTTQNIGRRDFFKAVAVTGAAGALAACADDPVEDIVGGILPPEGITVGTPYYFATSCRECAVQCGMVVKTREGRAVQVEGNAEHPINGDGLCSRGIASLQTLYNQNRIVHASQDGGKIAGDEAIQLLAGEVSRLKEEGKADRILWISGAESGAYDDLLAELSETVGMKRLRFDMQPVNALKSANATLFGRNEIPEYLPQNAHTLINFSADFLESWLSPVELSRKYAEMRAYKNGVKHKAYHVSAHMSLTGVNADEWVSCAPGDEAKIALALVHILVQKSSLASAEKDAVADYVSAFSPKAVSTAVGVEEKTIEDLAKAFGTNGRGLALGGGNSATGHAYGELQVAVHLLNYVGGSVGNTVRYGAEYALGGDAPAQIDATIQALSKGEYDLVIIDEVNIVHAAPAALGLEAALKKAKQTFALSTIHNESTAVANVVIPVSSFLESWGDARPRKGVYSLRQPVMAKVPKIDAMESGDLLLKVAKAAGIESEPLQQDSFRSYVMSRWQTLYKKIGSLDSFAGFWQKSLSRGGLFQDYEAADVSLQAGFIGSTPKLRLKHSTAGEDLSLLVVNSGSRNANATDANKLWLQEIPDPVTQVVWGSWLQIHPETAIELGIEHKDELEVSDGKTTLTLPAYVYYGIHPKTIAMPAGMGGAVAFPNYSQRRGLLIPFSEDKSEELVSFKVGENAARFLPAGSGSEDYSFVVSGISVKPTGQKAFMVSKDGSYRDDIEALQADSKADYGDRGQKSRGFVRFGTPEHPEHGTYHGHELRKRKYTTNKATPDTFYQDMSDVVREHPLGLKANDNPKYHDPYKFELAIDLDKCTGCSACVTACFAENNIPVVGKERQAVGREMSWLRVERWIDEHNPTGKTLMSFSPQMCQQCNNAGCEPVCPVYATYHNPDGLNAQIYNRCVGTRYCGNNCIYKQRRFNWRDYKFPYPLNLQLNPDVNVRSKGVMEKCTFCVQRIRSAKNTAKNEGRLVRDGEIKTACQSACPTNAITFGNAVDTESKLVALKNDARSYTQLEEVNFQPGVTFLRKIVQAGENVPKADAHH